MSVIKALLDLQEVDERIRSLENEIKEIPDRKSMERERLNGAKAELESAKNRYHIAQMRVNEMEEDVKERREKIQTLKKNQVNLKTNKEFSLYNLEIAKIEGDIETIENRQIIALDDVIPVRHEYEQAEAKYQEEQETVNSYLIELDARLSGLAAEVEEVEKERAEAVKLVGGPHLTHYERLSKTNRWPLVVKLDEKECICGGCHLKQPPSAVQMLKRKDLLVTCQICSRILYSESNAS